MKNIRTHYDNLKVARNAPQEVIRAAYKTLSQKHHPDRNDDSAESQRVMKIINESYDVLSNPETRRRHDAWILEQESPTVHETQPQNSRREIEFPPPTCGEVNFYDLDEEERKIIKDRASGENKDQIRIKLDGVFWNYVWCLVLFGWFYFIYASAGGYRWKGEVTYLYAGLTVFFSYLLARNISWIYLWHSKPLKSWLVVTPIYIMKFHLDRISYWPIWTVSDVKATHNYKNGSYKDTVLSLTLDGEQKKFSISPESIYQELINKLKEYDESLRAAVSAGDLGYIVRNDELVSLREVQSNENNKKCFSKIAIYTLISLMSFGFFSVNYESNLDRPSRPLYSKSKTPYNSKPKVKPSYVRPATAPNGAAWPSRAAYVENYPKINTNGLSSVTVDNSKNDSDVFVKLVSISANESYPVRVFFIPEFSRFRIDNINPGVYDIRYRDLTTGGLARSEAFTLEEISTYNGTQYSDMTMTLYKVRNGNMQTFGLSESEF